MGGQLRVGDEIYLPRGDDDVFVRKDGQQMVFFGRDAQDRVTHFCYATSPDTFERELPGRQHIRYASLAQRVYEVASSEGGVAAARWFQANHPSDRYDLNEAGIEALDRLRRR